MTNGATIPKEVIDALDEKDLAAFASAKDVKSGIDALSPKGLQLLASYKPPKEPEGPSLASDIGVKTTEGLLFGARPFVAGVGGGIGSAIGELGRTDEGRGLLENIKSMPEAFQKGFAQERAGAIAEEADVAQRRPGMSLGIGVGTALATAPLFALKGLQAAKAASVAAKSAPAIQGAGTLATAGNALARGAKVVAAGTPEAARMGALFGATNALGRAETGDEAINSIAKGTGLGVLTQAGANTVFAAAPAIARAAGKGYKKLASTLTGVSEKEIQTYATRANEVKDLIKKSGGDISEAADQVRTQVSKEIQVARQKLNNEIAETLASPKYQGAVVTGDVSVSVLKPLEDALAKVSKVTAEYRPGEINGLKNVIDVTKRFIGKNGQISVQDLHAVKAELQEIAKSSYDKGQIIFPHGSLAAKAAKGAAAEAKRILDQMVPEVAKANGQLSRLHAIEDVMNKNLIKAGKPEAALLAAGSGGNPRNLRLLGGLDKITGGSAVRQAENLAAARSFNNTQLLPVDSTGKAVARMMAAGASGAALGNPALAVAGMAASSPASVKLALDISRLTSTLFGGTAKSIGNAIVSPTARTTAINQGVENAVENSATRGAIGRRMERLRGAPQNSKKPQSK